MHPTSGAWANKLTEKGKGVIPSYITVNCSNDHPGAGFLPSEFTPLPIGDASSGLQNSKRAKHVDEEAFHHQLELRKQLDHDFDARYAKGQKTVRAYDEAFEAAVKLMKSKDLEAFDLSHESKETHLLYGKERFSKGVLLARRLVERGVRFVEVEFGGFDWHADNLSLIHI